jgi:hypothetical protein
MLMKGVQVKGDAATTQRLISVALHKPRRQRRLDEFVERPRFATCSAPIYEERPVTQSTDQRSDCIEERSDLADLG